MSRWVAAARGLPDGGGLLSLVAQMIATEIESLIRRGIPQSEVRVHDYTGGGDHFEAVVVAAAFAGKGLVERHQMVYGALQGAMAGPIHALTLKTFTPEEWARTYPAGQKET